MNDPARVRELLRAAQAGSSDAAAVLVDVLGYTDRPDLAEDLALAVQGRQWLGGQKRGRAIPSRRERRAALADALAHVDAEYFAAEHTAKRERLERAYVTRERANAARELDAIDEEWRNLPAPERAGEIAAAANLITARPDVLVQHTSWLLQGDWGDGAKLLALEIARGSARSGRESRLFALMVAFDRRVPQRAARQIWRRLPLDVQNLLTEQLREILARAQS